MHASRLFPEIQSWTKALVAMQQIITVAVKMVDYSQKKILYVSARNQSRSDVDFSLRSMRMKFHWMLNWIISKWWHMIRNISLDEHVVFR